MTKTDLPAQMRAAVLVGQGGPEMLQVRDDVAVPTPTRGQVLIKVAACGANNTDINTRVGWYSRSVTAGTSGEGHMATGDNTATWGGAPMEFPRIQGADISGRVVAVGEEVNPTLVGQRVLVDPWIRPLDDPGDRTRAKYLGSEINGGFGEFCAVPAANAYVHDMALSDIELAAIPCSWSTAEHMLSRVGLSAGQSVAVTGASGGVGSALIGLAKRRGARVVAVTSAAKQDAVGELGADAVITRRDNETPQAAIAANHGRFDVVADVVGSSDVNGWLEALGPGGRFVTSGAIAGPMATLDLRTLYLNDLEIYGATVYQPAVFANLVGYLKRGEIQPLVGEVFPLEEIHQAQVAFERKEHVGAIVIAIDS